ncbi:MAG: ABC transporter ATP-binding protein, partial [Thermodesulfobacteriota bacterium]
MIEVEYLTSRIQTSRKLYLTIQGPAEEIVSTLRRQEGVLGVVSEGGDGPDRYLLEMEKERDIRAELARTIVEKGWGLLELKSQELSLEEV